VSDTKLIAGDDLTLPTNNSAHKLLPAAEKQYNLPSSFPTNTLPSTAMEGEDWNGREAVNDQTTLPL
jgi:hypothetical protein